MRAFQTSILCSAFALALMGCQSKSYHISGTAEALADGDTLFLTSDFQDGIPSDTIIVEDGKFSFSGETDSVYLCMIYSSQRNEANIPFFIEPGNIAIVLSETPGNSRVSGTSVNNEWQILSDSTMSIGLQINRIAEHIYANNVDEEGKLKGMAQIDKLNQHFASIVVSTAERNVKNELGYFLITYYPEEIIDNATRERLIKELPDHMRQRPAVKSILKSISLSAKTSEGATIKDFSQPGIDGQDLSIMSEVRQHKVTIIDFWASWCSPCRQEMPFMVELYNLYKDRGLGIVGVSLDNERESWLQATAKLNITWPQMSDLKGWENAVAQQFNINSIPHTIVVDQKGKILKRGLRGLDLRAFIEEQLE